MSVDRKLFTRRSALHGTVAVTLAQILAACGSDDDSAPGGGGANAGGSAGLGGGAGTGGEAGLDAAAAKAGAGGTSAGIEGSYGELVALDGVISLPEGFRYVAFAAAGKAMSDGLTMPGAHDGMACFAGEGSQVILLRNHELSANDEASEEAKLTTRSVQAA